MEDYRKKLLSFALVALISSGISIGAYSLLNASKSIAVVLKTNPFLPDQ